MVPRVGARHAVPLHSFIASLQAGNSSGLKNITRTNCNEIDMRRLRYLTGGESHGRALTVILEGVPAGLFVEAAAIDVELARRQVGYGRGGRMSIEKDRVEISAGVRGGRSMGSPVVMTIANRDWENWKDAMSVEPGGEEAEAALYSPRPGHADLAGALKYGTKDVRPILERASARETAARVAAGSVARILLGAFSITVGSRVAEIGGVKARRPKKAGSVGPEQEDDTRCGDPNAAERMREAIDKARRNGDTLGGVFEVWCDGAPPGLGSHIQWDRRLDGRLAKALMSIPGIKGVEIGLGFRGARTLGSRAHDEIFHRAPGRSGKGRRPWGFYRKTNRAGGIEGGISNGERIAARAVMKPIPTLARPLRSVDLRDRRPVVAGRERADVCAVPAAAVVGESVVALEIADAFLEKFSGDTLAEVRMRFDLCIDHMGRL